MHLQAWDTDFKVPVKNHTTNIVLKNILITLLQKVNIVVHVIDFNLGLMLA